MSFLAWIVLGLISGFIASKIVNKSGSGTLMDIVLGIVGAVVGGWLFDTIGHVGVTGLNLYSILVAVVVAVVVLIIYHALLRIRTQGYGSVQLRHHCQGGEHAPQKEAGKTGWSSSGTESPANRPQSSTSSTPGRTASGPC